MDRSELRGDGRRFAINGRFLTQRMTGVQRYAYEIVAALDELLAQGQGPAIAMRLVLPPGAEAIPSLSKIDICRTRFGSGHAWDQAVLPLYAEAGVLSLGNFGPVLARNHVVCIHDANTFILPESYSRSFGLIYRTLLPLVGKRARRVATVSRFSADMLVKYGIAREEKIFIASNGHEHVLRWDARRARLPLLGALKRPYILLLGSSAKHKNIDIILRQAQAFDEAGIDVVVAGGSSGIFAANEPTACASRSLWPRAMSISSPASWPSASLINLNRSISRNNSAKPVSASAELRSTSASSRCIKTVRLGRSVSGSSSEACRSIA